MNLNWKKIINWFKLIIGLFLGLLVFTSFLFNVNSNKYINNHTLEKNKYLQTDSTSEKKESVKLDNFSFPDVSNLNGNNVISSQNLRNLYNVAEVNFLFAKKKNLISSVTTKTTFKTIESSTTTSSLPTSSETSSEKKEDKIDTIILVDNKDNKILWNVSKSELLTKINSNRTKVKTEAVSKASSDTTTVDDSGTSIKFNKVIYSPSANSFFVLAFVSDSKNIGNTVIIQIKKDNGNVSIYFDTATNTVSMTGTSKIEYKNQEFGQFVLRIDGERPNFVLLQTTLEKLTESTDSKAKTETKKVDTVTSATNDYSQFAGFVVAGGEMTGTIFTSDVRADDKSKFDLGNKIIVTNSIWLNNGLILTTFLVKKNETSSKDGRIYAFSFRDNTFQNPSNTESLTFESGNQTRYDFVTYSTGTFLRLSQKNNNALDDSEKKDETKKETQQTYDSKGKVWLQKLTFTVDVNNANLTLSQIKKDVEYLNNNTPIGITTVINNQQLLNSAVYVALSRSNFLVGLDSNFGFVQQIGYVDNLATKVNVSHIENNGLNYLIYLSNGKIIAYNNSGFIGYNELLNANSGIESVSPISFYPQNNVNNGANYFSQTSSEFQKQFNANSSNFFTSSNAYGNVAPNYTYEYHETKISDNNLAYDNLIKVNVFQQLRSLNASGQIDTTKTNSIKYFVGSTTYQLFNKNGAISLKNTDQLKQSIRLSLPSTTAKFYSESKNLNLVLNDLFNINNIDLYNKFNNANNISLQLTPSDNQGLLQIKLTIGWMWQNSERKSLTVFNFNLTNLAQTTEAQQLVYTLNPKNSQQIDFRFTQIGPQDLKDNDVINNFITLAPLLNTFNKTIEILPDEVSGTAIITIKFNFTNANFELANNSSAIRVTNNSVTWKTLPIFKSNPNINAAIVFEFNDLSKIDKSIIVKKPSAIASELNTKTELNEKIKYINQTTKLVNASSEVEKNISEIKIQNVNDLLGTFTLEVDFNNPFPGTLLTKYTNDFSGFATNTANVSDIFKVGFSSKSDYLSQFSPIANQNIFNLNPNQISVDDLLVRNGTNLSETNKVLGGLITLSSSAANAKPEIRLVSNNENGTILVSVFFNRFLEAKENNKIEIVNNKKIVHVFSGFKLAKKVIDRANYYLNWKAFSQLSINPSDDNKTLRNALTYSASDFAKRLESLQPWNALQLLANLSNDANNFYHQNPNLVSLKYTVTSASGSIFIEASLDSWNKGTGITTFKQEYSGFKVSLTTWTDAVNNFDPFKNKNPNALEFSSIKANVLASDVTANLLAKFFDFSGSILNLAEKRIYLLYNQNKGSLQIHFFVKQPNTIATSTSQQQTKFYKFNGAKNNDLNLFNISALPIDQLRQDGFVQLVKSGQVITGFHTAPVQEGYFNSLLAIILSTTIPVIILVPLMGYFLFNRNKHRLQYLQSRLSFRLDEEYKKSLLSDDLEKKEKK